MKKPSEYIRIPRRVLEDLRKLAHTAGVVDKSENVGLSSAEGYAHALGRCNSMAKEIEITLEVYLNA